MNNPMTMSICCLPDSPEVMPVLHCAGRWFSEIVPGTTMEETVAVFIRRRFLQAYGAEPNLRIPSLLALTTAQGSLMAAVGVRNASHDQLFLEDYLSVPVETVMPESGIDRSRIAEIAHLAGVEAGVSRYLFASLSVWLDSEDYDWVVCTGTDQLRNSFHRLGITTYVLASADPSKLPDGGAGWGCYYEHHPVVLAIRVADGISALREAGLLKLIQQVERSDHLSERKVYGFLA
ncbi:thermostable hemolysin [Marinobacter sp.]|uniref:thermostable hemolysin n=1 Tax=Marinobacter sp. TaxID=50741 RepID=UPI003562B787